MKHDMTLEIGDMVEGYYIIGRTSMRFPQLCLQQMRCDKIPRNI